MKLGSMNVTAGSVPAAAKVRVVEGDNIGIERVLGVDRMVLWRY